MNNMELRGTTRPITLEENGCCHHPSPLGDDMKLSPDRETPLDSRNKFCVLALYFLVMGKCLKVRNVMF